MCFNGSKFVVQLRLVGDHGLLLFPPSKEAVIFPKEAVKGEVSSTYTCHEVVFLLV